MTRWLERLARAVLARPWLFVISTVIPTALCGLAALTVPVDLSFTGIINRSDPEIDRYYEMSQRLDIGGFLPIHVQADEAEVDVVVAAVAAAIEDHPMVRAVQAGMPEAWLEANAAYLVPAPVFDDWLGMATRPDDGEGPKRLAAWLKAREADVARMKPKGGRILLVQTEGDPLDESLGGDGYFSLEAAALAAAKPFGATLGFAGLPAVTAQDQRNTISRVQTLTPLSLILVLLLFRLIEASLLRLLLVALPMLLALVATMGITGVSLGTLTILESFFGVMVFGLGIDFALHLMVRLRDERSAGASFEDALVQTLSGTGRGVLAGGFTTAGAFLIVAFAPDPAALHLGVSGAIGLSLCLLLMFTLLPACWTLIERRAPRTSPAVELRLGAVDALANAATRHPAMTLVIAAGLTVLSALGLTQFRMETDLEKVFNRDVSAIKAVYAVQEQFQLNGGPFFVDAASLEEAGEKEATLGALEDFVQTESLARYVRPDRAARKQALVAAKTDLEAQRATYAALAPISGADEKLRLEQAVDAIERLQRAAEKAPPEVATVPAALRGRLQGKTGAFIVYAYPNRALFDALEIRKVRNVAQAAVPGTTASSAVLEGLLDGARPWALWLVLAILGFVMVVLVSDLRQPRLVLLAVLPVIFGLVGTVGALCWAGIAFNVLTFTVVPLVVGLGVDDGIHVVHRFLEPDRPSPARAASVVGKAIVFTTLTTCISFGTLLFTNHIAMETMATVMLVGLPLCLLASVTVLPAAAVFLVPESVRNETSSDDEG